MDIYSNHRVPFSIGIWCRTHKYSPTAVQLTRDLKLIANIDQQIKDLEAKRELADKALEATLIKANQLLESSSNGY